MAKQKLLLTVFVISQLLACFIDARPRVECRPCPLGGCPVPTNCTYGIVVDNCDRASCGKGPGDRCKIKRFRIQGNCGEGLFCHCGRCQGCSSITFDCFERLCVIPMPG